MKKRVIKIAALVVLFAAVLVISNVILNRGNDDQVVDMDCCESVLQHL